MSLRILLAESDPTVARLIRYCLEGQGHAVTVSSDGIEAISMAYQNRPDLILLNQVLPNLSGRLVCQGLRDDERTRQVPIILITDLGEQNQTDQGWACPIQGILRKPFTPSQILQAVEHFEPACQQRIGGGVL